MGAFLRGFVLTTVLVFLVFGCGDKEEVADDEKTAELFDVVRRGNVGAIRRLVESGINPDTSDDGGKTPLMIAAQEGKVEAAEVLLALGANPRTSDKRGYSAINYAIRTGNMDLLSTLVSEATPTGEAEFAARLESLRDTTRQDVYLEMARVFLEQHIEKQTLEALENRIQKMAETRQAESRPVIDYQSEENRRFIIDVVTPLITEDARDAEQAETGDAISEAVGEIVGREVKDLEERLSREITDVVLNRLLSEVEQTEEPELLRLTDIIEEMQPQ